MNLLYKLGFTGRFNAIKIGVLIDTLNISLSIQAIINSLLEEGLELLILDAKKEYMIRDKYFDLIIADSYVVEKLNSFDKMQFLTFGGCLLLQTVNDTNNFTSLLPLKFQGVVKVLFKSNQITYNGILYKNEQ
jgi:hypothetical protein